MKITNIRSNKLDHEKINKQSKTTIATTKQNNTKNKTISTTKDLEKLKFKKSVGLAMIRNESPM